MLVPGGATALEKELLACRIVFWLRENYRLGRSGSLAKEEVYSDYLNLMEPNRTDPVIVPTYFGKLVKKAFPSVRCNRKGPRGKAKQHYTHLQRVDHQREAERQRFHVALTEPVPTSGSSAATTATISSDAGAPGAKPAPFQSYISSELSYLNYLLKKVDTATTGDRSGSIDHGRRAETAGVPKTREGRTDSPAAGGVPPARVTASVVSLSEAASAAMDGEERDWDWVFVYNKSQPKKQSQSARAKRARDDSSGSDEESEAEGAEAKRRRSHDAEAGGDERREERRSQSAVEAREGSGGSAWRSELAAEHLQPQNFFASFHHRIPSPSSSSPSSSPSPSHTSSSSALRSCSSALYENPPQPLLPGGGPGRHSANVVSPADIHDGETQSPPCPTGASYTNSNGNDQSLQPQRGHYLSFMASSPFTCSSFSSTSALSWPLGLSTTSSFAGPSTSSLAEPPQLATCSPEFSGSPCPPEFFGSWHSLPSFSSPVPQTSSLPSACYRPQLLSDIEPYDYQHHQHQLQHRPLHEQSYHHHPHQQQRVVPAYYCESSNYTPPPPKPLVMSLPAPYHAGTYLDPQPTLADPVLQRSRALCGDEADRGFAPLKFGTGRGGLPHPPSSTSLGTHNLSSHHFAANH